MGNQKSIKNLTKKLSKKLSEDLKSKKSKARVAVKLQKAHQDKTKYLRNKKHKTTPT